MGLHTIELIIVSAVISLFSIGGVYLLFVKTRPKKMTYRAKIYTVGEGVKPPLKDDKGNIVSNVCLKDLKPWTTDVLEVIEKKGAGKIYRLQKFKSVTPPVDDADLFENFGGKFKEVNVLYHKGTCTLLKIGYDSDAGKIFQPVPVSTMNMVKSEIALRKERLQSNKDIFDKIMPGIMLGIMVFGILGVAYFHGRAVIESSKENYKTAQLMEEISKENTKLSDNNIRAAVIVAQALAGKNLEKYIYEKNNNSSKEEKPPSIE